MKTRIKYIKKNHNEGYYAVQIKRWLFWKTVRTDTIFANVEKFIDTLAQIDEFNNKANKAKSSNKIVYEGWAVRNVYKHTGIGYSIGFFESYPRKCKSDCKSEMIWKNTNGSAMPTMEIKTSKLFGKECLEPMKLRITIEPIED